MHEKTVYLAGPIKGCTWGEANTWRHSVCDLLKEHHIRGISPLRCEPIVGERYEAGYADPKFGTARAIGSKNIYDVRNCDMCLIYLPTPPKDMHQSYGTIIEMAWSNIIGTPTVVVSDDPAILEHPVVSACASWMLEDMDDAIEVIIGVLGGYAVGGKHV